jgi:hypothetical protein
MKEGLFLGLCPLPQLKVNLRFQIEAQEGRLGTCRRTWSPAHLMDNVLNFDEANCTQNLGIISQKNFLN